MVILWEILSTSSLNLQINTLLQDKNKEYDFTQFFNFILDSTDVTINMNGDASHEVPSYNDAAGEAGHSTVPGPPGSNPYAPVPSAPPPTGDLPPPPSYDEVYGTYIYRQRLLKSIPKCIISEFQSLLYSVRVSEVSLGQAFCACLSLATIMHYCKVRILSVPVSEISTYLFLCLRGESITPHICR